MWSKNFVLYFLGLFILPDPVVGIVCYICNSITLEACAMTLDETVLPYGDCKSDLQCVMSIVDSVTYRGCSSTTPTIGATYKKNCNANLCNKGVYPPGRPKCYHCSGPECVPKPEGKPNPCLSHREEDECYTQVIGVDSVNRGCRSDTNRTNGEEQLEYCNINGCNDKPALSKLICAQCDSKNERGCKMDLPSTTASKCNITQYEECEVSILLTQEESCFMYHNLDRVVRGCTRYIPEDIKMDEAHRHECNNTDFCNAACLEQQMCIVCDSSKNENCRSDASTIPKNVCGSAEISSCYACELKDWHVERGCGSPPIDDININRCYECDGSAGCNEIPLTRCYKCTTTAGANCASWERPGYNIDVEECEEPGAQCIIAAFSSGEIQRGCESSNLTCNHTLNSCHRCNGNFCNKGRYPPDRLRCYQCIGDVECADIDIDPMPCLAPISDPSDACFEFYDSNNGGMIRGCRSNAELYYRCIFHDGGNGCRICYEDGCNNSPAKSDNHLECYKCNRNDPFCQSEHSGKTNLVSCSHQVPFGSKESCFITQHMDGTTSRGCKLDDVQKTSYWDHTSYCSTNACNFPATISFQRDSKLTLPDMSGVAFYRNGYAVFGVRKFHFFLIILIKLFA